MVASPIRASVEDSIRKRPRTPDDHSYSPRDVHVALVIPNYNGARWLPAVLESVAAQTVAPAEVLVVDDGSTDGSTALVAERYPAVRVLALAGNGGFARTANAGIAAVSADAVALVNTDVVLAPDWLECAVGALAREPRAAAVATKLVDLEDPAILYSAGDVLRRDGACEQRGRFERDNGWFDAPGEVFSACAAAALYRRSAVLAAGGFDERLGTYLEDVELGLRLRLAGWRCRWEPRAVARHAGGGSSAALRHGPGAWVERNTLLLVARFFRVRWLPLVAYRQLAWTWHAARAGRLREHLAGVRMALPLLGGFVRERSGSAVAIEDVVPRVPIRGPRAGGHPSRHARP
jgi:GT2 family glycosyltransferase